MNEQDLYKLTLEYLETQLNTQGNSLTEPQFDIMRVVNGVDSIVGRIQNKQGGGYTLTNKQQDIIHEIVWDLIIQRILTFSDQGMPWLRVTDYGKEVVKNRGITPHDHNGYIANIKAKAPAISELAVDYLYEGLLCFRAGAQRAASVMIGVVSEEVFSDMARALEAKTEKVILPKTYKPFKQVRRDFEKYFNPIKIGLPKSIQDNIDNTLTGIYEVIKRARDDSGHPTGTQITRDEVNANLSVLPLYIERVYKVIDALK